MGAAAGPLGRVNRPLTKKRKPAKCTCRGCVGLQSPRRMPYICRECGCKVAGECLRLEVGYPFCGDCFGHPLKRTGVGGHSGPKDTVGLDGDPDAWRPSWISE